MKKIIFVFWFFLMLSVAGFSQFLIGLSEEEVREKLKERNLELEATYLDDGKKLLHCIDKELLWELFYVFEDGKSIATIIVPLTQKVLNFTIGAFNETFVRINSTTWHFYDYENVTVIEIKLEKIDDKPAFVGKGLSE